MVSIAYKREIRLMSHIKNNFFYKILSRVLLQNATNMGGLNMGTNMGPNSLSLHVQM
jgi:hypothetical protein